MPASNDIEERSRFFSDVRGLLKDEQYDKLEAMETELRSSRARFPGGDWKLERFYQALEAPESEVRNQPTKEELMPHYALVTKWVKAKPESLLAQVSEANVVVSLAWSARGRGFSNTVTEQGFRSFEEGLKDAEEKLNKVKEKRKQCLNWYLVMDDIARGRGWSLSEYNKLFEEAVATEPLFFPFYVNKATYLLPRWHGAPGDWQNFADESAKQTGGEEGEILYTRICWIAYRHEGGDHFLKEHNLSWPRIKKGWILMEKNYGASFRNMNGFLSMTGDARDGDAAEILLNRLGENWEPDFWRNKEHYDDWRNWAMGRPRKAS